ncbi:hypothetical protein BDN72DRAFT_961760 [Pluteus cervinus]|uniref:Uncharacterized protein n=1 Tax=Pluteus cervinus TaxID=181527 RepID=A0ACD3AL30_9AGAR|nr:hypothetical protein BDN72DRAFT_961760 [Pluteus cervinus]
MSTTYNDYDHILQSPGHLSTESTTSLRTQIDLEIRELHHRLQYLATVRNTLAPVARLPREVLGKIFDLVRVDDNGRVLVKRILPASWVSQHWRDVVLGDPKLWNQIDRSNCHWAIWCLIRSKTTPLFIQLSDDAIEILPAATIDTLLRELPRIQLLRLGGEDLELDGRARNRSKYSSIDHILLEAPDFKSLLTGTSTLLKTLHLGTYVTGDTFANLAMPNLAHLKLQSCTFKWNEFLLPSLKTLCVQRPSTTIPTIDILKLLSRMPLLEEITLNDALSEERLSGSHLEPLRFPHLRLLTLSDYFTNQLSDLANNIVIPQNASLSIAGSISSGVRVEEVLQSFFPVVQRRINAMSLSPDTAAISRHSMMDTFCVGFGRCDTNGVIGNTVVQSQSAGYTFDTPLQIFRNLPGPVGDIRCLQIRGFWFLKDGDFDDFVRLVEMMPNVEELVLEEFVAMSLLLHLGNFPNTSLPPRLKKITHGKIYSTLNNIQLTDAQIEGLILWRKNSSTKMVLKDPDLKSDPFNSKRQEAVFDEVNYEEGTHFLFSADEY